eukprot:393479-Pelagomonas_calceolata.AAC.6
MLPQLGGSSGACFSRIPAAKHTLRAPPQMLPLCLLVSAGTLSGPSVLHFVPLSATRSPYAPQANAVAASLTLRMALLCFSSTRRSRCSRATSACRQVSNAEAASTCRSPTFHSAGQDLLLQWKAQRGSQTAAPQQGATERNSAGQFTGIGPTPQWKGTIGQVGAETAGQLASDGYLLTAANAAGHVQACLKETLQASAASFLALNIPYARGQLPLTSKARHSI